MKTLRIWLGRLFLYTLAAAGLVYLYYKLREIIWPEPGEEPLPGQLGTPPTPPTAEPDADQLQTLVLGGELDYITCVPPPPPPPTVLQIGGVVTSNGSPVLGSSGEGDPADEQRLWSFLQQETYRQRGEGYRTEWAFHLYAASNELGAPLALSTRRDQQISFGGERYGFQAFARDIVFNVIPRWSEVQSLNASLTDGTIPPGGLVRDLLEAAFAASGAPLRETQAFAQLVIREKLGPALTDGFTVTVDGERWDMQVFALDSLTSRVGRPSEVFRLSELEEGNLRTMLLRETYSRVAGVPYDPASSFHQFGLNNNLGAPLTGVYQANFEGNVFEIQVFATDTLYALPQRLIARQSALTRPDAVATPLPPARDAIETVVRIITPDLDTPDDALSNRRPTFNILPIQQSQISQFYGYTRFAAGDGRRFYGFTQGRHSGIDFAAPVGTPLIAIDFGVVVWAGANRGSFPFAAGPRSIVVRYGNVYALYGHTASESVRRGQTVRPGQVIGGSGFPSAPHLHFEVRPVPDSVINNRNPNQDPVNPGFALNPVDFFSPDQQNFFLNQLNNNLGGDRVHFCQGTFRSQGQITFGAAVDNRSCQ